MKNKILACLLLPLFDQVSSAEPTRPLGKNPAPATQNATDMAEVESIEKLSPSADLQEFVDRQVDDLIAEASQLSLNEIAMNSPQEPFRVLDCGSGEAQNTRRYLEIILQKIQASNKKNHPLEITVSDSIYNKWSIAFENLADRVRPPRYFVSGVGRSFYERLLPPDSVSFLVSTASLDWLPRNEMPNIKEVVLPENSKNPRVTAEMNLYAMEQWRRFLNNRAKEVKRNGRAVITVSVFDPKFERKALEHAMQDTFKTNLVPEACKGQVVLPQWFLSSKKRLEIVANSPDWRLEKSMIISDEPIYWSEYLRRRSSTDKAEREGANKWYSDAIVDNLDEKYTRGLITSMFSCGADQTIEKAEKAANIFFERLRYHTAQVPRPIHIANFGMVLIRR